MRVFEINGYTEEIKLLDKNRVVTRDLIKCMPINKIHPAGEVFYFVTDLPDDKISKAMRDSFEKYKKAVTNAEWICSTKLKDMLTENRSGGINEK